jgi:hypothetical protein
MDTGVSRPGEGIPGEVDPAACAESGARAAVAPAVAPPYPPSWVDRLTARVDRLRLPAWLVYLGMGVALSLLYLAFILSSAQWASGTLPFSTALVYSFLNGLTGPYLLGLIHYLDNSAAAALARFRPVLAVDDAGYDRLRYQLTTLPPRPMWVAAGLGVVYGVVAQALNMLSAQNPGTGTESPILVMLLIGYNFLLFGLVLVVVYHTLHQLRLVNTIYTRHTRINLFQLGPLYALSGLTARTTVGIGIPTYIWFQANSAANAATSAPNVIQTIFLSILLLLTFIWPLAGAHNLLEREKQRLQDEVARRIEATIMALQHAVDAGKPQDITGLKGTLDGLLATQGVIDKLRTWPWRTETVSGLGLAFLLPILIWVVQRVLERLGI